MSDKKMWQKEDVGLEDDGIEMDTEKIVLGEEELLENEAFFNPGEKTQIEREENAENDSGRKKSTIFKEEYERLKKEEEESIKKEEKRKKILQEGFEAMDNSDNLNSDHILSDFNAKYPTPDSKPSVSTFVPPEDRDELATQKNEPKRENAERNVSSVTETQEEEKNSLDYKLFNVSGNLDRCLELLDEYKEKRKSEPNTVDNSSDFKKLGLNIFYSFKSLMNNLSADDLQIISADDNNLSVKLSSQKSNIDLEKLKKVFLSVEEFGNDYEMHRFTGQFDVVFSKDNNNIYSCFEKFKQKCSEKNISNKNLDEIDGTVVDLRKMYRGKTTYGKNDHEDNQVSLSDSFRKKVEWHKNAKKFFVGLIRKFEDLTRKVFRKLEDIDRKVSKNSAKFIYGKSFKPEAWEEEEQTRKERREKEDLARKEKREKEDQEMENSLTGKTADEVLEETNEDIMYSLSEEEGNSLTSSKAFEGATRTTADEISKKTNEDIVKMEKNRSKGQNNSLNFNSH